MSKTKSAPLIAIVTGMQHSGTTILSQAIAAHPNINCGFECGLLLADTPANYCHIEPWYTWLQQVNSKHLWSITKNKDDICKTTSWMEAYNKIMQLSPLFTTEEYILDKTPQYIYQLPEVIKKVPNTPIIIIYKEPISLYQSWKKRALENNKSKSNYKQQPTNLLQTFMKKYHATQKRIEKFMSLDNIYIVNYIEFLRAPKDTLEKIFQFIGINYVYSGYTEDHFIQSIKRFKPEQQTPLSETEVSTLKSIKAIYIS